MCKRPAVTSVAIEDMDWSWMTEDYVCFTEDFDADAELSELCDEGESDADGGGGDDKDSDDNSLALILGVVGAVVSGRGTGLIVGGPIAGMAWNLLMGVGTAIGPLTCGAVMQWRGVDAASIAAAIAAAFGGAWYLAFGAETLVRPDEEQRVVRMV